MTYVKVENGIVTKYPYSFYELRVDNPQTAFSSQPSAESLAGFNTYIVQLSEAPSHNPTTQKLVNGVTNQNGSWVQTWTIENLPQEDAEKNVRLERDTLLSATDWMALSDVTLTPEWAAYRQSLRDVPQQEGFPFDVDWPVKPA